jgi:hypothetical protein
LNERSSQREITHYLVGLFAGYAAEVRLDPAREGEGARATAREDDYEAEKSLGGLARTNAERDKLERRLRARAASLVSEHWAAVTALARELLEHRTVEGDEAELIVAIAEGEQPENALAEYRRHRYARIIRPARIPTHEESRAALAAALEMPMRPQTHRGAKRRS